jgi:hypothetical protein
LEANSYQAILTFDYTPLNTGSYQNGLWISWGNLGQGVSSAYVCFSVASSSSTVTSREDFDINITSQVIVGGIYQQLDATHKQVNLTVDVLNEGKPALAESFSFSYQDGTEWETVNSPSVTNNGDGSYNISFAAESGTEVAPLIISVLCIDQRGVSIGANYTCST